MNADTIAKLIIALGPSALSLIPQLTAVWSKPTLSLEEVKALCEPAKTAYDKYIADARVALHV